MIKAFSLLELIIVILVISIISVFAVSNYTSIFSNTNLVKLKSDYALIQNGISKLKKDRLLLSNNEDITILDEAVSLKEKEKLFSNVIEFDLLSTNKEEKNIGKWLKKNSTSYTFLLEANKEVNFILEQSIFKCKYPLEICKELE